MPIGVASALGSVIAIAETLVIYLMIMPASKRETLSPFLKWLHDFFNFKTLWLEKILKAIYVLATMFIVCTGVMFLFTVEKTWGETHWMGGYGFLMIILGPIALRILYEAIMLFIILVRNSGEINNKLSCKGNEERRFEKTFEKNTEDQTSNMQ